MSIGVPSVASIGAVVTGGPGVGGPRSGGLSHGSTGLAPPIGAAG
jgi:hypothetical protein